MSEEARILQSTVVEEYRYIYAGGKLMQVVITTTVDSGTPTTETLNFAYDTDGNPMMVSYNGTDYYYTTNLQGDVTSIVDISGSPVVEYTYDAWGNITGTAGILESTLGLHNPLRYRGYVYDTELGLYYLQSRYYDPELGRFLNADAFASTGQGVLGNNMFAYCNNNPIAYADPSGCFVQHIPSHFEEEGILIETEEIEYSGTFSIGLSGSLGVGPWSWGVQVLLTFDSFAYAAVQYGYAGGISADPTPMGFSASATPFFMVSNAKGYQGLEGPGLQAGGSANPLIVDYSAMLDETGETILYHGASIGYGATTPGVHVMWGETYTWFSAKCDWNVFYYATQY